MSEYKAVSLYPTLDFESFLLLLPNTPSSESLSKLKLVLGIYGCRFVYHKYAWCLHQTEEGFSSSEVRLTDSCQSQCGSSRRVASTLNFLAISLSLKTKFNNLNNHILFIEWAVSFIFTTWQIHNSKICYVHQGSSYVSILHLTLSNPLLTICFCLYTQSMQIYFNCPYVWVNSNHIIAIFCCQQGCFCLLCFPEFLVFLSVVRNFCNIPTQWINHFL